MNNRINEEGDEWPATTNQGEETYSYKTRSPAKENEEYLRKAFEAYWEAAVRNNLERFSNEDKENAYRLFRLGVACERNRHLSC